jgi:hypothetical protein
MCCATESRNPLQQAGILHHVLDYVGPGHWCFVAEVSSLWKEVYESVAGREAQINDQFHFMKTVTSAQMTTLSEVFASPSRVRLAQARGLECAATRCQIAAGMHADVATLKAAHELGMRYTEAALERAVRCNQLSVVKFLRVQGCDLSELLLELAAIRGHTDICAYLHAEQCPCTKAACHRAAGSGHASTLRWLHGHGCPWDADTIHSSAAMGGSVEALVYLQQQGIVFTAAMLTEMLSIAGACNRLAAAKWLRQKGAEWPAALQWHMRLWSGDTLIWARAEGCSSPTE